MIPDYFIRLDLALELHLKECLIEIIHNTHNIKNYLGLPRNGNDLFDSLDQIRQNKKHKLHKVLNEDQWNKLCPPTKISCANDWDITLLIAVIRSVIEIKPKGGWNIKALDPSDNSIGAYVFMIRELRNFLKHPNLKEVSTLVQFTKHWDDMENILIGLQYSKIKDFKDLKTTSLDENVPAIQKLLTHLEFEVEDLSNVATDNTKSIQCCKDKIKHLKLYIDHLANSKADQSEVDRIQLEKADKSEIKQLQNEMEGLKLNRVGCSQQDIEPLHWNIHEAVVNFNGRTELLENIHQQFQQNIGKPVILSGIGGIGKTQIAAMYIKQHRDMYVNIIWINALELHQSLWSILKHVGTSPPANTSVEILSQLLSKQIRGASLFIIDDLIDENINDFIKIIRNLKLINQSSFLVTTQLGTLDSENYHIFKVPCFTHVEATSFLRQALSADSNEFDELICTLQSFPLAMQQAVCYMKKFKVPVENYIDLFKQSRKSLLNVNLGKSGIIEYDKTLLTVWKLAFEKLQENSKALKILGMIAYMNCNRINKNTFLYYDEIDDKLELDEIIVLLSEFSLVDKSNENKRLIIHGLVQKVIKFSINEEMFNFPSNPNELLKQLLSKIIKSFKKDKLVHTDESDLWYPHFLINTDSFHDFDFFLQVALNRSDLSIIYPYFEFSFLRSLIFYDRTNDFNVFIELIKRCRILIEIKINACDFSIEEILKFEQKYSKQLKNNHFEILKWKLGLANFLNYYKKVEKSKSLLLEVYDTINRNEQIYDSKILIDLAEQLAALDNDKCKEILSKVNENHIVDIHLKYQCFRTRTRLYIIEKKFDYAENTLQTWETFLTDSKVPSNHNLYLSFHQARMILLLKCKKYHDTLQEIEKCISMNCNWLLIFKTYKAIALVRLERIKEAFELFSDLPTKNLDLNESILFAYVKFLRHDFNGIYDLLNADTEYCEKLCDWIKLYCMTLSVVNRKLRSINSSNEQNKKLLTNIVQSKQIIINYFEQIISSIV